MTAVMTPVKKPGAEVTKNGGPMVPPMEFPFFLSQLRDEFDRMFNRFLVDWPIFKGGIGSWRWGLEVKEEEEAVIVRAEAPGFEAGDFDVQVFDNRLLLRASKKTEIKGKEGKPSEYREQEYCETVTLPGGIDKGKVEAKYQNGVLTVTVPRTAEGKGKRVPVKSV